MTSDGNIIIRKDRSKDLEEAYLELAQSFNAISNRHQLSRFEALGILRVLEEDIHASCRRARK